MSDHEPEDKIVYDLQLKISGQSLAVQARVPKGHVRVTDMLPIFQVLNNITVDAGVDEAKAKGKAISCRAGCGVCCNQLVPISQSEARNLAEFVEAMPVEQKARVKERFQRALEIFEEQGLGTGLRRISEEKDREAKQAFGVKYFKTGVPCPFLEEESCSIHPHRPMSCREYLVSSPAENCADPGPGRTEFVPLPTHISKIIFRFDDGEGRGAVRWLPLVLALEWAEQYPNAAQRTFPGPKLFESFLRELQASMQKKK